MLIFNTDISTSAPTFVAITQMWWRRSEQTNRNASWYAMNGVTNMVWAFLTMRDPLTDPVIQGWQSVGIWFGSY
jgi:hypothetical protein